MISCQKLQSLLFIIIVSSLTLSNGAIANTSEDFMGECDDKEDSTPVFGAECAYLTVKENPEDSQSRDLEIYIMRIPSIRQTEKPPIFFVAGGPGQASSVLAEMMRRQFSGLLVEHDFVFVDQRGTGKSNPLNCDIPLDHYFHLAPSEAEAIAHENFSQCVKSYSDSDLRRYTTPYAINDLESVRQALAYEKIVLWGGSYGTRVLLAYLQSNSSSLEAVILDGLAPISIRLPYHTQEDANASLENVFETCERSHACAEAFPQLRNHWLTLLDKLQDMPVKIKLPHPRTQQETKVYIDHHNVSMWVRFILYNRNLTSLLPYAMLRATQQDFSILFSIQALAMDDLSKQVDEGLQMLVLCAEDGKLKGEEKENSGKTGETSGSVIRMPPYENFEKLCQLYPETKVPLKYYQDFSSDVPALILSGHYDPVTPPRWGAHVENFLPNSKHIIAKGGHHGISGLGCFPKIIKKFVDAPKSLETLDTTCTENIKPLDYFIDSAGPKLSREPAHD